MYKISVALKCRAQLCVQPKLWKIMKLSFIIILSAFLQVNASSYAQRINFEKKETKLREILNEIRRQSGYNLVCDADLLNNAVNITVSLKNVSLEAALNEILKGQPLKYVINRNTILVTSRSPEKVSILRTIVVKGTVSDKSGPLPGVTVRIKNKPGGVVTNAVGAYIISVADANAVLVFTSIGYVTQEVPVENKKVINVTLSENVSNLNDVVVVGYGTQKRVSLSAAVASVKASDIENQVTGNTLSALAGQLPGLDVQQNTGSPGANPVIRIRGTGSLGGSVASNAPLYVVDGLPLDDASDFNAINPADIENIDVLKDAAASAIYGARGGNGVILITTKKGKSGAAKLNFSYYTAFQTVGKKIALQNTEQSIQFNKEVIQANWVSMGGDPNVPNGSRILNNATNNYNWPALFDQPLDQIPDTDWQDEIYRRAAPMSNYQISAQGGSDKLNYFISGNYFDQNGIVRSTDFTRYTGRINLESTISNKIKIGLTFTPTNTCTNDLPTNGHFNAANGEAGTISSALASLPWIAARLPNGLYGQVSGTKAIENLGYSSIRNPLQAIYEPAYRNINTVNRYLATAYFEYKPLKRLTFRSNFGIDYKNTRTSYYKPSTVSGLASAGAALTEAHPLPAPNSIRASESWGNNRTLNWDNTLNYDRQLSGSHQISLLAGYSVQRYENDNSQVSGVNGTFTNDLVPYPTGASQINGTYSASKFALISLFGRLNYDFKGRYLFSAALRNDASSRFPKGKKEGYFPSVSAAWRVSEEPFFKILKDQSFSLNSN